MLNSIQEKIRKENPGIDKKKFNELTIHTLESMLPEVNTLENEVCIITKNNRKPSILDALDVFGDTKINVFIYEYQKDMYEWLSGPNINKIYVPIPEEQSSVAIKRKFVQDTMGAKKYWVLDDDLSEGIISGHLRPGKIHRRKIKTTTSKVLKIIEIVTANETFAMAGGSYSEIAVGFFDYKDLFINSRIIDQFFLFNGKLMQEYDVHYSGDPAIIESWDVEIDAWRKGLKVLCCPFAGMYEYTRVGSKKSIASTPTNHTKAIAGSYVKWGDIFNFRKDKRFIVNVRVAYSKIATPLHWNSKLLNICKEVVKDGDHNKILKYLDNKHKTKSIF